ncbi:DUF4111 domain-containing protein [Affinibrenneria salicis]|uniref:Aminoglycoside (3'') (9) adenylyltransferase n=1 Tax=Affinibrenneria salicis TaxID=2590031 RepID=A0A5J5G4X1_9GAMM|nr:aminoglycoside adenylyltransferase domain-containing protein [Affinibrenneria salicis]KAA9001914.1 DUF4111 domain-containing protein [Affinibrenneria salicis]
MQKGTPQKTDQMQAAVTALSESIGSGLLAVYLHGSAVSGGLRPQSDIDLLAIIERDMTDAQRRDLTTALLHISGRHPARPGGPRCIEVIAFCQSDLLSIGFPARANYIYGEWLREAFEAGRLSVPTCDPEYTLLLEQARQQATILSGENILKFLPQTPLEYVRLAIQGALPILLDGLQGDERNVLLTLARMWRTASTGQFVTKDVAADWVIPQIPEQQAATLNYARRAYLGEIVDAWEGRRGDAKQLARHLLACITAALRS